MDEQASSKVPSREKWSREDSLHECACRFISARNRSSTLWASSLSRFLVNVVGCQAGSSRKSPTI